MKHLCLLALVCATALLACQKEMSRTDAAARTIDSLNGRWQIEKVAVVKYDANAQPADTLTAYDEELDSYIEFKQDATFMVAEQLKYAYSGKVEGVQNREIKMLVEKETFDDFGQQTNVFNPPKAMVMRIQLLTDTRAILNYSMAQGNTRFHYFLKR